MGLNIVILLVVLITCVAVVWRFNRMSKHFLAIDLDAEEEKLLENQCGASEFKKAMFLDNVGLGKKYKDVRSKMMSVNGP